MAWKGRFGDEEGSGLELSLGLPGYFSGSPAEPAGAASFLFLLSCGSLPHHFIRNEFHGFNDPSVLCLPGGFRF